MRGCGREFAAPASFFEHRARNRSWPNPNRSIACCGRRRTGFGISAEDDLLLVEDVRLIGQQTTIVSVEFDDEAVADFFDEQVDAGLLPERFFRL